MFERPSDYPSGLCLYDEYTGYLSMFNGQGVFAEFWYEDSDTHVHDCLNQNEFHNI
jgi:hypothetical protein